MFLTFYNDYDAYRIAKTSLIYLYSEEEAGNQMNFTGQYTFEILNSKINDFYNALMMNKDEVEVGRCYITDRERDIFHRTVSLLSDNIMFEDNKEELGV